MKKNILIVDFNATYRRIVREVLTREGYIVVEAEDAEIALDIIEKNQPDLVITGLSMPGMGGMGLIRRLRNNDKTKKLPIIVATCRANLREFFEDVDISAFLAKPFGEDELLTGIKKVFGQA